MIALTKTERRYIEEKAKEVYDFDCLAYTEQNSTLCAVIVYRPRFNEKEYFSRSKRHGLIWWFKPILNSGKKV